jgi:hypothetical protein
MTVARLHDLYPADDTWSETFKFQLALTIGLLLERGTSAHPRRGKACAACREVVAKECRDDWPGFTAAEPSERGCGVLSELRDSVPAGRE